MTPEHERMLLTARQRQQTARGELVRADARLAEAVVDALDAGASMYAIGQTIGAQITTVRRLAARHRLP